MNHPYLLFLALMLSWIGGYLYGRARMKRYIRYGINNNQWDRLR